VALLGELVVGAAADDLAAEARIVSSLRTAPSAQARRCRRPARRSARRDDLDAVLLGDAAALLLVEVADGDLRLGLREVLDEVRADVAEALDGDLLAARESLPKASFALACMPRRMP